MKKKKKKKKKHTPLGFPSSQWEAKKERFEKVVGESPTGGGPKTRENKIGLMRLKRR